MPPTTPVAVVDALNALLEAEQNAIIRFMGEGSPYLSRATVEVRRPIQEMVRSSDRHMGELYRMIDHLGGTPRPRGLQPEEQYLAFLSLKFLLPKLVDEKQLIVRRYDNALRAIPDAPPGVTQTLRAIQSEHKAHAEVLKRAAQEVIAASR